MASNTPAISGDVTPVTGGIPMPASMVSIPSNNDVAPTDDLGRQAWWLLKLYPDIAVKLPKRDLSAMDDNAKRQFILEMHAALGIVPLHGDAL